MSKRLAIIPVRTGSKRLPGKNTRDFYGRPLFSYAIDCAIESGLFDEIHVSTESEEVAKMSEGFGAKPNFMRPNELATDEATLQQVCEFVLNEYRRKEQLFDFFCILWPTSPLRTSVDVVNSYHLLGDHEAVVSVCEYDFPYYSGHILLPEDKLVPVSPDLLFGKQDRPTVVCVNSSLCWVRVEAFYTQHTWLPRDLTGYKMPRSKSTDIDTQIDWDWAEFLYKKYGLR